MRLRKAGVDLSVVAAYPAGTKLTRLCACESCRARPRDARVRLLPCNCHGVIVDCPCKLREKICETCGRVFVATAPYRLGRATCRDIYEIQDPHTSDMRR